MKLLGSDYDGTLFFKEGYKEKDLEAIKSFQSKGNLFGVCSGRPLTNLFTLDSEKLHFDFYIGSSGAAFALDPNTIIDQEYLAIDDFKTLYTLFEGNNLFVVTPSTLYVSPNLLPIDEGFFDHVLPLDQDARLDGPIVQISLEFSDLGSTQNALKLLDAYSDRFEYFQNGNSIDIAPKGVSKGIGIKKAADYFGVSLEDVACIGDNFNDLPMFKEIENCYTFRNSPAEVKEQARYHVDSISECISNIESRLK